MKLRFGDDTGQSTVELALILPLLVAIAVGLAQVVSLTHTQLMLVHATRETARQVAVDRSANAHQVALDAASLDANRLHVVVSPPVASNAGRGGSTVTVSLTYRAPIRIPLVGVVHEPELTSAVTVWLEG